MNDETYDDLLSRFVDGDATAEEAARIAANPTLRSRVNALRSLPDRLAVDVPEHAVDQIRIEVTNGTPALPKDDLHDRRLARALRRPSPKTVWLSSAAAAVSLALAIGVVQQLDSSPSVNETAVQYSSTAVSTDDAGEVPEVAGLALEASAGDMANDLAEVVPSASNPSDVAEALSDVLWESALPETVCDEAYDLLIASLESPPVEQRMVAITFQDQPFIAIQAQAVDGALATVLHPVGTCADAELLEPLRK